MLILKSWLEFFQYLSRNPQSLLLLAVMLLVILFLLSRTNNFMEKKGVDRAIDITRAFVGFLMYFIIAPIVIFLFINAVAFINALPLLDISFLGKWIALTFSSYWWLLNCIFQNKDIVGQEEAYTVHAIIRILWIILPVTLIWIQISKTTAKRLLIIPVIVLVIMVTRHKIAEETFLTKDVDIETLRELPIIGYFFNEQNAVKKEATAINDAQQKIISIAMIGLIAAGLCFGLLTKYKIAGLSGVALGILGFFILSTENIYYSKPKTSTKFNNVDSLISVLDSVFDEEGPESLTVYKLTVELENIYKTKENLNFPDSLCKRYKTFFYDRCAH